MMNIILSRTDSLGDVVLTLPMAGVLKNHFPDCKIIFLGTAYSKPLIEACKNIDHFVDWKKISAIEDSNQKVDAFKNLNADVIIHVFPDKTICLLAKKAGIRKRISSSHRWYSWLYCNERAHFSRKNSDLHEAQLNMKLLEPLGITKEIKTSEIPGYYGLTRIINDLPHSIFASISQDCFNLILHPKSKGSAREWGLDNFSRLINLLPSEKFKIFITGTKEEGESMKDLLTGNKERVTDLTGKLSLSELLAFINLCDGMVAASTGPLHIAAALGKKAIGLYAPMRPIFPRRWAPLGNQSCTLVIDKNCNKCRHSSHCECIQEITPEEVASKLM